MDDGSEKHQLLNTTTREKWWWSRERHTVSFNKRNVKEDILSSNNTTTTVNSCICYRSTRLSVIFLLYYTLLTIVGVTKCRLLVFPPSLIDNDESSLKLQDCGGLKELNLAGEKCGVCGGKYFTDRFELVDLTLNDISKSTQLTSGSQLEARIAMHRYRPGWLEFRMCQLDLINSTFVQKCFDRNILNIVEVNSTRKYLRRDQVNYDGLLILSAVAEPEENLLDDRRSSFHSDHSKQLDLVCMSREEYGQLRRTVDMLEYLIYRLKHESLRELTVAPNPLYNHNEEDRAVDEDNSARYVDSKGTYNQASVQIANAWYGEGPSLSTNRGELAIADNRKRRKTTSHKNGMKTSFSNSNGNNNTVRCKAKGILLSNPKANRFCEQSCLRGICNSNACVCS